MQKYISLRKAAQVWTIWSMPPKSEGNGTLGMEVPTLNCGTSDQHVLSYNPKKMPHSSLGSHEAFFKIGKDLRCAFTTGSIIIFLRK